MTSPGDRASTPDHGAPESGAAAAAAAVAIADRLATAHRRVKERDQLRQLLDRARGQLSAAERELSQLQQEARVQQSDVDKLQSFSGARMWALLTGKHEESLRQEQLESEAALGKAAEAKARCDVTRADCAEVEQHLAGYTQVENELAAAAAARESFLVQSGSTDGRRLTEIAAESGELAAELRQLDEAIAAGGRALGSLAVLEEQLGTASGWSTYDTFFGGGLISTAIKHDHMDRAAALSREADAALRGFGRELGDVGLDGVDAALSMSGGTRFLDMWFDNIVTDLSVRSQIQSARERAQHARIQIQRLTERVSTRRASTSTRLAALADERRRLLH